MKVIHLKIQAIGPYLEEEAISFAELQAAPLFLIHGKTGSGKSIILDCISFALYGDNESGNERRISEMRSRFAPPNMESVVTLEFEIKNKRYRIRRTPLQERSGKRGSKLVTYQPTATIYELILENGEWIEKIFLGQKVSDVNYLIITLLGFKGDQFQKVMIIPQGRFREFLMAETEDRSKLLAILFQTTRYGNFEIKLNDQKSAIEKKMENTLLNLHSLFERYDCANRDALELHIITLHEKMKTMQLDFKQSEKSIEDVENKLKQAELSLQIRNQLRESERNYESLLKSEPDLIILQNRIKTLKAVIALKPSYLPLKEMEIESNKLEFDLANTNSEMEKCLLELLAIEKNALRLEQKTEQIRLNEKKCEKIQMDLPRREKLEEDIKKISLLEKDLEKSKIELHRNQKNFNDLAKAQKSKELLYEKLNLLQEKKHELNILANKNEAINKNKNEMTLLGQKKDQIGQTKRSLEIDIEQLQSEIFTLENDYSIFRKKQQDRWQAEIALSLKQNQPCPVCGSLQHPSPYHGSEKNETKFLENNFEQTLTDKKKLLNSMEINFAAAQTEELFITERVETLSQETLLSTESGHDIVTALEKLSQDISLTKMELAEAEQNAKKIDELFDQLESTKDHVSMAEMTLIRERAEFDAHTAILHYPSLSLKELNENYQLISKEIQLFHIEIEQNRKAHSTQTQIVHRLEGMITEHRNHLQSIKEKKIELERVFQTRLVEINLTDLEEFEKILQYESRLPEWEEKYTEYYKKKHALTYELEKLRAEASKHPYPDPEPFRASLQSLKIQTNELLEGISTLKTMLANMTVDHKKILELEQANQISERELAIMGRLADTMRGQNSLKLSFHRYVQGALFDDVLENSSYRLMEMTQNRFQLHRRPDHDYKGKRYKAGLDLDIFDHHSGESRPVSTLSGGESFLASLALALGLADVVQRQSGGIFLETMFIDEGFGSLDSESLDLALNTLMRLNQHGRMIGIISHVNEIKDRIPYQLHVINKQGVSTTKIQLA